MKIILLLLMIFSGCNLNKGKFFLPIGTSYNSKSLKFGEDIDLYILNNEGKILYDNFDYAYNGIFLPSSIELKNKINYGIILKNYRTLKNYMFIVELDYEYLEKCHYIDFKEYNSLIEATKNDKNKSVFEIENRIISISFSTQSKYSDIVIKFSTIKIKKINE